MAGPRKQPIPLGIVAGPLGAGKTTLVNRMLRHPDFADTAVILNEFGAVALENALIERAEDGIIALGAGCVCCTVRGELVEALERLLRGLDNGRVGRIGRVIVEADAAADPSAIWAAVTLHPYLSLRFRADGTIAVIAEADGAALASRPPLVRRLAAVDVVALSRTGPDFAAVAAAIAAINPPAIVVDAATVDPIVLTGRGRFEAGTDPDRWLGPPAADSARYGIHAFAVERERPIPLDALERFLEFLVVLQGPNLIRLRGLVATGDGESAVIEGAGGVFRAPRLVGTPPGQPAVRFLVTAGDLDRQGFERYLDAFLNEARVDTPDRAALTDNPLRVAGFSARPGRWP